MLQSDYFLIRDHLLEKYLDDYVGKRRLTTLILQVCRDEDIEVPNLEKFLDYLSADSRIQKIGTSWRRRREKVVSQWSDSPQKETKKEKIERDDTALYDRVVSQWFDMFETRQVTYLDLRALKKEIDFPYRDLQAFLEKFDGRVVNGVVPFRSRIDSPYWCLKLVGTQ